MRSLQIFSFCSPDAQPKGGRLTDASYSPVPHAEPVCLVKSAMPSSIKYTIIGEVESSKQWDGGAGKLLPKVAQEARKMGADAVVNLITQQKMGALAWARPVGAGTAVKLATAQTSTALPSAASYAETKPYGGRTLRSCR